MHNLDDYAWYEVGDRRYYNKIQALFDHLQTRLPIRWNVNDDVYDQFDWTVEPSESLEFLYAQRAQEIRNKYDYLVLHFSGGSDSCNILETFVKNNIHLDEILIRGSYTTTSKKTGIVAAQDNYSECLVQSLPLATWVKEHHMPHVKINLVDTVEKINEFYKNNSSWIELSPAGLSPSVLVKSNLEMLDSSYTRLVDQGKRIAHIMGVEKPRIYRHNNFFYTQFVDKKYMEWASEPYNPTRPQFVELFYWSKHTALMQIKQLHLLKKYIKLQNLTDADFDVNSGRRYERLVADVIYNRTLPLITEHEKDTGGSIIESRDYWFAKDQYNDAFVNYKRGLDYLKTLIDAEWHDKNNFLAGGIRGITSKPRYLGN